MKDSTLEICTAYEQGYGHGYSKRNLTSPYRKGLDECDAWEYGYSEGSRSRSKCDIKKSEK